MKFLYWWQERFPTPKSLFQLSQYGELNSTVLIFISDVDVVMLLGLGIVNRSCSLLVVIAMADLVTLLPLGCWVPDMNDKGTYEHRIHVLPPCSRMLSNCSFRYGSCFYPEVKSS